MFLSFSFAMGDESFILEAETGSSEDSRMNYSMTRCVGQTIPLEVCCGDPTEVHKTRETHYRHLRVNEA